MLKPQNKSSQPLVPILGLVAPCFNEAPIIGRSAETLVALLDELAKRGLIHDDSFILFVDDGSRDGTWDELTRQSEKFSKIRLVKLSRNFGHQNALMAGLSAALDRCDATLCLDADLQHDIGMIPKFLAAFAEGNEVVYGVKVDRAKDSFFKKLSAQGYYRLLALFGVPIVYNHADFRLMSNRVLGHMLQYEETNLFLRGIIPQLGFKFTSIQYAVQERTGGESKYSFKKMISLAWDGITSFSRIPLRLVSTTGFITMILSLYASIQTVFDYWAGRVVPGWSSVIISIYFLGGVQLLAIGIIGEYIGKIYLEVKRRPRFIVESRKGFGG